jgi:hypothetical protein
VWQPLGELLEGSIFAGRIGADDDESAAILERVWNNLE